MSHEEKGTRFLYTEDKVNSNTIIKVSATDPTEFVPPLNFGSLEFPPADAAYPVGEMTYSELTVEKVNDLTLLPKHVVLSKNSNSLIPYTFMRNRLHHHGGLSLQKDGSYQTKYDIEKLKKVDYPLYHADTDHPDVYGHILLEVIPSLWAIDFISDSRMKIATSINLFSGYLAIFEALGIGPDKIHRLEGPTHSPTVYLPSKIIQRRRFINPLATKIFNRIKKNLAIKSRIIPYERIYISRSKVNGRKLLNEKIIEELFYSLGFEIIHPQELSIYDQIKLFSEAKYIAGSGGSAMHNTVFSSPECKVLIISSTGWLVIADALICQAPNQLAYVFGAPEIMPTNTHRTQNDWTVKVSEVKEAVKKHFGL